MKFNFKSFRIADFLSKRINTILLIVILIVIMTGHVVCSCCKVNASKVVEKFTEGLSKGGNGPAGGMKGGMSAVADVMKGGAGGMSAGAGAIKQKIAEKVASLKKNKEGFTPANTNFGQSSPYLLSAMGGHSTINPKNWNQKDLTIVNGKFGNGVSDILNRPQQQIPLPEGELDMFANTQFKPECCNNNPAYSLSTGCACMTNNQYNYLVTRGGNNVPYSEY